MLSNLDETFLNEFNSTVFDGLFPSSIPTHFNMTNSNDCILAYSIIKNSVVQIQRLNNKELLHLTNINRHKMASHDDSPRVRGPKSTRFTCPICGLITVSMERLQRHVNQHGQILHLETYKSERKISSLSCEKCKATFSSVYALRKHQRVHTRGLFCKMRYKIKANFFSKLVIQKSSFFSILKNRCN
jgi:transcription elongation factor Elf1